MGATGAAYGTHLHLELRKGPAFSGNYNSYEFLDKYTYRQFNPMKYLTNR
jgi:murein DD-endopeptidase MepM/ murein hydrolase activator NlpD